MNPVYQRNIKILPWIFALLNTPMYFFAPMYLYVVTGSYLTTMLVISVESFGKAIMEVPTGVISDRYLGRRNTEVVGSLFKVLGFIFYALGMYNQLFLFIGALCIAVGLSMYSGNTTSLLHDTLKMENKEKQYHHYFAKFHHYKYLMVSLSVLTCGLLAYYLHVVYVVYFCIMQRSVRLVLGLCLKETKIYERNKATIKDGFIHIYNAGVKIKGNRKLQWLSLLRVLRKSFDAVDQLGMVFYQSVMSFFSIAWLLSGSLFICNFTSLYSERIAKKLGFLKTFLYVRIFAIPLQMIAYAFPGYHSPFLVEIGADLNPIETSAESALLHKEFSDKERATMESLIEIVSVVSFSIFASFFGWLADVWSLTYALLIATSLKLVLIPLFYKLFGGTSS